MGLYQLALTTLQKVETNRALPTKTFNYQKMATSFE